MSFLFKNKSKKDQGGSPGAGHGSPSTSTFDGSSPTVPAGHPQIARGSPSTTGTSPSALPRTQQQQHHHHQGQHANPQQLATSLASPLQGSPASTAHRNLSRTPPEAASRMVNLSNSTGSSGGTNDNGSNANTGLSKSSTSASGSASAQLQQQQQPQWPWSSREVSGQSSPFPRYGHATNAQAGREGDVYLFGGLVRELAKNDLWQIDAATARVSLIPTTGHIPSPRVGHAALLIGNAFILFGGDTRVAEEGLDGSHGTGVNNSSATVSDDSLYLLNTNKRTWTRADVVGARPSGRYGHTINMLGPKVLIFGGQVDGFFFNDLVAFDLNKFGQAKARWELIDPAPGSDVPQARTNHVAVTFDNKLYVFGGTNGTEWFNDVWQFDPNRRIWTCLKCSGYVPQPREGHSGTLVGDTLYIFGGRDIDGHDLGDIAALKIPLSRWFTFQNLGQAPTARSGHALTSVDRKVLVIGGEGMESAARGDDGVIYALDTAKIRFPPERKTSAAVLSQTATSAVQTTGGPIGQSPPTIRSVSGASTTMQSRLPTTQAARLSMSQQTPAQASRRTSAQATSIGRVLSSSPQQRQLTPRAASSGSTMAATAQTTTTPPSASAQLKRSGSLDSMIDLSEMIRQDASGSPAQTASARELKHVKSVDRLRDVSPRVIQQQALGKGRPQSRDVSQPQQLHQQQQQQYPAAEVARRQLVTPLPDLNDMTFIDDASAAKVNGLRGPSGDSIKQTPDLKLPNEAWLLAELAHAKRQGYETRPSTDPNPLDDSPRFRDLSAADQSVILGVRAELDTLRSQLKEASALAQGQVDMLMAERDAALKEATYERARNAAMQANDPERLKGIESQRVAELERRLDELLTHSQTLEDQLKRERLDVEQHRERALQHADLASSHETTVGELTAQHESLSAAHLAVQKQLKELQKAHEERGIKLESLETALHTDRFDRSLYDRLKETHDHHLDAFAQTQSALSVTSSRVAQMERDLDSGRAGKLELERQIQELEQQLAEARAQSTQHQKAVRDLEADRDAARQEADTHRNTHETGVRSLLARTAEPQDASSIAAFAALQRQLDETRLAHSQTRALQESSGNQVTQLEQEKTQMSAQLAAQARRLVALERQLTDGSAAYRDLQATHNSLTAELLARKRDADEAHMRLAAMNTYRSGAIAPDVSSDDADAVASDTDMTRLRELEQQLQESLTLQKEMESSHARAMDDLRALEKSRSATDTAAATAVIGSVSSTTALQQAEQRAADAERQLQESTDAFHDRLTQLEADYASAVHYVKGTEKMLRKMKEELAKSKEQASTLQGQLDVRDMPNATSRAGRGDGQELESAKAHARQLEHDNLELERRMKEAEHKVNVLLDQFEQSVDTYRRRSQLFSPSDFDGASTETSPVHATVSAPRAPSFSAGDQAALRSSSALDQLAKELDQLRGHWEREREKSRHTTGDPSLAIDTKVSGEPSASSPESARNNVAPSIVPM
ncbi:Negative regulator of mitotic exit [Savitreella phatthalungensis]